MADNTCPTDRFDRMRAMMKRRDGFVRLEEAFVSELSMKFALS